MGKVNISDKILRNKEKVIKENINMHIQLIDMLNHFVGLKKKKKKSE